MGELEILEVPKNELEDRKTVFAYESDHYYCLEKLSTETGWEIRLKRKPFPETFIKFDDSDKLIQPYKGDSKVYLAFMDGIEAGQLQIEFQEFNRSMRVWDIDVWPQYQRMGIGKALMTLAIKRTMSVGARRIVLEVQSSNSRAIEFYKTMGFDLVGMDTSNYTNYDIARKEVRLEMAIEFEP